MTIPYLTGTVSISAGSKTVTGTGTAWATALIVGGVFFCNGLAVPIASIDSDRQLSLALGWPGAAVNAASYAIVRDTDYARQSVANATALAEYIRRLDNDTLQALADVAPAANTLIVFTGAGKAETLSIASLYNRSNHTGNAGKLPGVQSLNGGPLGGFRNKIINGQGLISQRGNSFTIPASSGRYTADRIFILNTTDKSCTVLIDNGPSAFPPRFGVQFSERPATGDLYFIHRIEDVRTVSGRQHTFTVEVTHVDPAAVGSYMQLYLEQHFGNGGSPTVVTSFGEPTLSQGKKSFAAQVPSTAGKTFGTNHMATAVIRLVPRSTGYFGFTKWSLVEGDATQEDDPFSPRHIQQELALCQRYYEKTVSVVLPPALLTNVYPQAFWKVTKRVPPTLVVTPTSGTGAAFQLGDDPLNMFFQITGNSQVNQAIVYGDAEL